MKVLVTGGSGFLGSWVCQLLSERGDAVRALVRKSSNRKFLQTLKGVELAEGGIEDAAAVEKAAEGVDAIVHCAGLVKARNEAELEATNVEGTRNIIEAARKAKVKRVVHVSSLEASGPSQDGRPVPDDQERPITAYGRSKLAAEKVVIAAKDDLHVVILRPGAIYGPRDQEILEAFRTVSHGLAANVAGGRALGSFIFASDCAGACVRAIDAKVPSGSIYFVDDGAGAIDQKQVMDDIARALGKKFVLKPSLPAGALRVVARGVQAWGKLRDKPVMLTPEKANMLLHHFVCSSERTRKDLGWTAKVPWSEGVGRTARWYRENGWL
jgi:nucleoside-diphosphate-sugar epimerase